MDDWRVNPAMTIGHQGITDPRQEYYNLNATELTAAALAGSEGVEGEGGTLLVTTGRHAGGSPKDKHVVRSATTEGTIWWDNNRPMTPPVSRRSRPTCWPTRQMARSTPRTFTPPPTRPHG